MLRRNEPISISCRLGAARERGKRDYSTEYAGFARFTFTRTGILCINHAKTDFCLGTTHPPCYDHVLLPLAYVLRLRLVGTERGVSILSWW